METNVQINANVPPELKAELDELAREHFHSTAAEVRAALARHLEVAKARGETTESQAAVELARSAQTEAST